MMRIGSFLTLIVALVLIFQSCKKENDVHCPFLAPDMIFVGFSENERDTMIIRRYEKNSMFSSLIDTFLVSKANINTITKGKDSVQLVPANYDLLTTEFYANDWEIYFPSVGQTVRATDITPRFTTQRNAAEDCQSYVASVDFDGVPYTFSSWFDVPYRVYAVKQN